MFGLVVQTSEKKHFNRACRNGVEGRVNEYLRSMKMHRYSFDEVTDKIFKNSTALRRFLYKK